MLPAHFSLTVISLTVTEYTGHTHSHKHKRTQVTLLTAHQPFQWSLPVGCQLVWLTASSTLRWYLTPGPSPHTHISAIMTQHAYNHVLASHPHISFVEWFVSSVPLNGMCLFSAFSANLDVDATLKNLKNTTEKKKKTQQINMFPNSGGWGFEGAQH